MKKFFILVLFFGVYFTSQTSSFAFDSINTNVKYFPLNVGNKYVYHYSNTFGGDYYIVGKITNDTIVGNRKYYFFENFPMFNSNWYSIDSSNAEVLKYNCGIFDSLSATLNTGFRRCDHYFRLCKHIDTVTYFGSVREFKEFSYSYGGGSISGVERHRYMDGIGLYLLGDTVFGIGYAATRTVLKGCVINGVLYGDTSANLTTILGANNNTSNFSLSQNYPNPFNPNTIIEFTVPYRSEVSLKVYDISGKEIEILIDNKSFNTGKYHYNWNGSILPSGVYFYILSSNNQSFTKKMVLLK